MPDQSEPSSIVGFDLNSIKAAGGVFKFGKGLMGKSAIVVGILIFVAGIAVWRLKSDIAIMAALLVGAAIFLWWLSRLLKFCEKHPDVALLEGAEWSGYQRFQAAAKGYIPSGKSDSLSEPQAPNTGQSEEPDK